MVLAGRIPNPRITVLQTSWVRVSERSPTAEKHNENSIIPATFAIAVVFREGDTTRRETTVRATRWGHGGATGKCGGGWGLSIDGK